MGPRFAHIFEGSGLVASEQQPRTKSLQVARLHSIKTRIIVFALLATCIPSLFLGWLSYVQNRRSLDEKITQKLRDVTAQASRELDLWLKEALYNVRVFSSSYVVSENLEKIFRTDGSRVEDLVAHRRLKDYLRSVRVKFMDYEELMVVDLQGAVVASSADEASGVKMPENWLAQARGDKHIIGEADWDDPLKAGVMVIAESVRAGHGRLLGVLAAKLNFRGINEILRNYVQDEAGELYVITSQGGVIASTRPLPDEFLKARLTETITRDLFSHQTTPLSYVGYSGKPVVGTLNGVPQLDWGVVAEEEKATAYAQIVRLRNLTLALVAGLVIGIGLGAYLLGQTVVRALDRLTSGAAKVAAGDLDVDLPVVTRSEVGYLTEVFNDMVARLRQGREELAAINETLREKNSELEQLSKTDSLTGLYNRKHLMETLEREVARGQRYDSPFSVLMIDIDHFKEYNDTYGHLAGDQVLSRLAAVFKKTIRTCDYAARYGGEEFMVILPGTGQQGGAKTAERIRRQVVEESFDSGGGESVGITISVGVSSFPDNGDGPESLIKKADVAMYQAKEAGRNQVILAESGG
jgi:diguanylate cyclase (GGDEF)-like protein